MISDANWGAKEGGELGGEGVNHWGGGCGRDGRCGGYDFREGGDEYNRRRDAMVAKVIKKRKNIYVSVFK